MCSDVKIIEFANSTRYGTIIFALSILSTSLAASLLATGPGQFGARCSGWTVLSIHQISCFLVVTSVRYLSHMFANYFKRLRFSRTVPFVSAGNRYFPHDYLLKRSLPGFAPSHAFSFVGDGQTLAYNERSSRNRQR